MEIMVLKLAFLVYDSNQDGNPIDIGGLKHEL